IELRGRAFGLRTWQFDDAQPGFLESVEDVVKQVRTSRRPGFLVIDTMRMGPHSKGDDLRDVAEMEIIRKRDPLMALAGHLPPEIRARIEIENRSLLTEVRAAAESSPEADSPVAGTGIHALALHSEFREPAPGGNVRAQLNTALDELLEEFPNV